MKNKIAVIGIVGLPASYGGFETLVEHLTKKLHSDYDFTVYCSKKSYTKYLDNHNGAKLVYLPFQANGIQSVLYDIVSILKSLRYADVLLILGVSGCIFLPVAKLLTRKKIIVNIDGLEWKRNKWGSLAKRFLKFSEKLAVKYADIVVADNKVIQDYVFSEYSVDNELIAYGGDHANRVPVTEEILGQYPFLFENYAFTVCRIEPENNIHVILDAATQQNNILVVVVGNWRLSRYGMDLYNKYSNVGNIKLLDPIYDQSVLNQLRSNCFVYLHGHSAGGTNPSLVEAMYLGLPIIAYDIHYNKATTENKALYFSDANELTKLLVSCDKNMLLGNGEKMSDIANKNYRWDIISSQYAGLFGFSTCSKKYNLLKYS